MSTKELENKARRLKGLKNRQEALQQEIDQLEDDLKREMENWGIEEVQAGPFRVFWKRIESSRFDDQRFRDDNATLYNLYTVRNYYRKLSIV